MNRNDECPYCGGALPAPTVPACGDCIDRAGRSVRTSKKQKTPSRWYGSGMQRRVSQSQPSLDGASPS